MPSPSERDFLNSSRRAIQEFELEIETLAGWPPSFDHVLGDARLGDLKPELEQLAVNPWRAPKRIFDAHPPDQYAQLRLNLRSLCLSEFKLARTDDEVRREMA